MVEIINTRNLTSNFIGSSSVDNNDALTTKLLCVSWVQTIFLFAQSKAKNLKDQRKNTVNSSSLTQNLNRKKLVHCMSKLKLPVLLLTGKVHLYEGWLPP